MNVSLKQIKFLIHESNLIEGYDDPEFDAQGLLAWQYLSNVLFDQLDHHCIKKVQKMVTLKQTDLRPDWRGYYRDLSKQRVWVANREAVAPELVPSYMGNWLMDYKEGDPVTMHIRFEKIHPFVDGNGRTGRLLMWWMQKNLDQELSKITYDGRQAYYRWFA